MANPDILSEVLKTVRLRGTVYFRAAFRAPWGLEMATGEYANFHIVNSGRCWLRTHDGELLLLKAGDAVLLSNGDRHALLGTPQSDVAPAPEFLEATGRAAGDGSPEFGGAGGVTTTLTCGHFEFDPSAMHPLFNSLDAVIHVPAIDPGSGHWLQSMSALVSETFDHATPGAQSVTDRLAEALFVQILRQHLAARPDLQTYLAAAHDAAIGKALELIHAQPELDWTVAQLAAAAAMSRSRFAKRFQALVGTSPILYLAQWRLLKARQLLADTTGSVQQVSELVGYQSEFAFAKAFKRQFGLSPGQFRKSA